LELQAVRCRLSAAGCPLLAVRCWLPAAGYKIQQNGTLIFMIDYDFL
jgi:hypothetical protein